MAAKYSERVHPARHLRAPASLLIAAGCAVFLLPYIAMAEQRALNPVSTTLTVLGIAAVCYVVLSLTWCMRIKVESRLLWNGTRGPVLTIRGMRHSEVTQIPLDDVDAVEAATYEGSLLTRWFGWGVERTDDVTHVSIVPGYRGPGLIVRYRFKRLYDGEQVNAAIQFPSSHSAALRELIEADVQSDDQ